MLWPLVLCAPAVVLMAWVEKDWQMERIHQGIRLVVLIAFAVGCIWTAVNIHHSFN